jgi:hypothetical protein
MSPRGRVRAPAGLGREGADRGRIRWSALREAELLGPSEARPPGDTWAIQEGRDSRYWGVLALHGRRGRSRCGLLGRGRTSGGLRGACDRPALDRVYASATVVKRLRTLAGLAVARVLLASAGADTVDMFNEVVGVGEAPQGSSASRRQ